MLLPVNLCTQKGPPGNFPAGLSSVLFGPRIQIFVQKSSDTHPAPDFNRPQPDAPGPSETSVMVYTPDFSTTPATAKFVPGPLRMLGRPVILTRYGGFSADAVGGAGLEPTACPIYLATSALKPFQFLRAVV